MSELRGFDPSAFRENESTHLRRPLQWCGTVQSDLLDKTVTNLGFLDTGEF